jgi:hypothetical protein
MLHVLRGENPAGVSAGVSLELLTERAGKRFEPQTDENREQFRGVYLHRLDVARRSNAWIAGRDVAYVGEDGERDIKQWTAEDFTGSVGVDVEAVPVTAFSQTLKAQRLLTAVKVGLIDLANSPKNRARARQLLALHDFDESYSQDYKRAQMENEKWLAGMPLKRGPYDNDEVHSYVHMQEALSRKWEEYPEARREELTRHIDEHLARMVPSVGAGGPPNGNGSSMTPSEQAVSPDAAPQPDLTGGMQMSGATARAAGGGAGASGPVM